MKKTFDDPIAPRVKPKGLEYDERCGKLVCRGSDYGVGFNQPVGSVNGVESKAIPKGCRSFVEE